MTFQPNIPQPGDLISVSQNDILNNFTSIGTAFDVNHIDFNAPNAGKHMFIEMPNQVADPAGAATEGTIYTKIASPPSAAQTEIFFRRNAGTITQLTRGDPVIAQPGTTFLPGGMLLNFGAVAATSAGVSQNFATAFTGSIFAVSLAILSNVGTNSASMTLTGLTAINIYSSVAGPITVYYMVIGR